MFEVDKEHPIESPAGKCPKPCSSASVPLIPATMQNYNNQLVKYLEDMRGKREAISKQIEEEENNKVKLQDELNILSSRLKHTNDSLEAKKNTKMDCDRTIKETEGAYFKILESSQTLLHVLKRESKSFSKKCNQKT